MIKGYYIHNQKKDGTGVSKKIDSQIETFLKHSDISEILLEPKKENWFQRKIRMKILKARVKYNYSDVIKKIENPDFLYVRKQVLDNDYFLFLKSIKERYSKCKIIMEIPIYPYWDQYPQNIIGKNIIAEEKRIIEKLPGYIDLIAVMGHEENVFGIKTVQINNGVNLKAVQFIEKKKKTKSINLIAVAKWRDVHGYERIIQSLKEYYASGGKRDVYLHMVGEGPATELYRKLASDSNVKDRIIFYGFQTGRKLDEIYNKADIGLGIFAFYKSGADYVSLIKSGEYFAKGLPIVSAVEEDCMKNEGSKYSLILPNDDSKIMMEKILDFYDQMYPNEDILSVHQQIRHYAEEALTFDVAMSPVIEYLKEEK